MAATRLVVFDFDGTLADTNKCIVSSWQHTLRRMGLPEVSAERIQAPIGLPLKDSFRIAVPEERLDEAVDIYHEAFHAVARDSVTAFDGVREALEAISSLGIDMAVASSRGNDSLEDLVDALDMTKYFRLICGGEFAEHPKPAPDLVLHILSELGVSASDTLVVGDAVFDIGMGNSAGCRTCGVTWGNQSREQLMTSSPDMVIDRVEELVPLL